MPDESCLPLNLKHALGEESKHDAFDLLLLIAMGGPRG
jgi:hypothetical protein